MSEKKKLVLDVDQSKEGSEESMDEDARKNFTENARKIFERITKPHRDLEKAIGNFQTLKNQVLEKFLKDNRNNAKEILDGIKAIGETPGLLSTMKSPPIPMHSPLDSIHEKLDILIENQNVILSNQNHMATTMQWILAEIQAIRELLGQDKKKH